jgi:hypothetical protein
VDAGRLDPEAEVILTTVTYQWRFHGTNAPSPATDILGATNATWTISNAHVEGVGFRSVRVSNPLGSEDSWPALLVVTPVCVSADLYVGLTISGGVAGKKHGIFSTTSLTPPVTWTSNASIVQTPAGML